MDLFETRECVKLFLELYPSMTTEQAKALQDGIGEYDAKKFRLIAGQCVLKHKYVNDAIPSLIAALQETITPTYTAAPREKTWVDHQNEANRAERESVAAQHAADDALIAAAQAAEVEAAIQAVADAIEEPIRSNWKRKGLASRAVRCAVAEQLRKGQVSHAQS